MAAAQVARLSPVAPKAGIKLKDLNSLLSHLPSLADDAPGFASDVESAEPAPEGDAWES